MVVGKQGEAQLWKNVVKYCRGWEGTRWTKGCTLK